MSHVPLSPLAENIYEYLSEYHDFAFHYITRFLKSLTQEEIIALAKEVELSDMIDWEGIPLEKDRIYQLVGSQAYELYDTYTQSDDGEQYY